MLVPSKKLIWWTVLEICVPHTDGQISGFHSPFIYTPKQIPLYCLWLDLIMKCSYSTDLYIHNSSIEDQCLCSLTNQMCPLKRKRYRASISVRCNIYLTQVKSVSLQAPRPLGNGGYRQEKKKPFKCDGSSLGHLLVTVQLTSTMNHH